MAGRPKKEFDQKIFENACGLQVTEEDMCYLFETTDKTLNNWIGRTYQDEDEKPLNFSEAFKRFSVRGRMSLRRWQFKMAEHNATMAIWLGKQYLGQTDKQEIIADVKAKVDPFEGLTTDELKKLADRDDW